MNHILNLVILSYRKEGKYPNSFLFASSFPEMPQNEDNLVNVDSDSEYRKQGKGSHQNVSSWRQI